MKILLTGDYFYNYKKEHKDYSKLKLFLDKYDACIINWEGSYIGDSNQRVNKSVNLEFSLDGIHLPQNSILCLSNNHVLDFGLDGLENTIRKLRSKKFKWFGLQSNQFSFDNFEIFKFDDLKICFMGFGWKNEECRPPKKVSPGVTDFTKNNIDRVFKEIKNFKYDLVISYIHAGYEFEYYPLPLHVELSRYLVDMGSDIVYQSHTHCIQPYEIYKSNYIFYGLGNFYFSSLRDRFPNISDKGIMVEIILHDNCKYDVNILDIVYNRIKKISSVSTQSNFLETHRLTYESSKIYSKNYKKIRTRKKNPRPIMHYNRHVSNEIKYRLWLAIVKITGVLKIRRIIKIILGWQ